MATSFSVGLILSKTTESQEDLIYAILTASRFAAVNLSKKANGPEYAKAVEALEKGDKLRVDFLKACLRKMGLRVNETEHSVPSLSLLHLVSVQHTELPRVLDDLSAIITRDENGSEVIKCSNDTFVLERPKSTFSVDTLKEAVAAVLPSSIAPSTTSGSADDAANRDKPTAPTESDDEVILDYDKVIKRIFVHEEGLPSAKETPYFNMNAYYSNWKTYVRETNGTEGFFGKTLIYGEVVTSTSTMLDK